MTVVTPTRRAPKPLHATEFAELVSRFQDQLAVSPKRQGPRDENHDEFRQQVMAVMMAALAADLSADSDALNVADQCLVMLAAIDSFDMVRHDQSVLKLRNEYVLKLTDAGLYKKALDVLYGSFVGVYNRMNKNVLDADHSSVDVVQKLTANLIPFNIFNAGHARDVTSLYVLFMRVMSLYSRASSQFGEIAAQFLKLFNRDLESWFDSLPQDTERTQKFSMVKKTLVAFSNDCRSALKLNFLIKAIRFAQSTPDEKAIITHFETILNKLCILDDQMVYQSTAKNFHDLLQDSSRQHLNLKFTKAIPLYVAAKSKHDTFRADDLNWTKFQTTSQSAPVETIDQVLSLFSAGKIDLPNLLQHLQAQDAVFEESHNIKLMKCVMKALNSSVTRESESLDLISIALQHLQTGTILDRKHATDFLDYVTVHIRDMAFSTQLLETLKALAVLYKKSDQLAKYRNLSNVFFKLGGDLISTDFQESLSQWMNCINYEYNILSKTQSIEDFRHFKTKVDRISNLLLENKKYHECKIFLNKNFQCYMNLETNKDFLQLKSNFLKELTNSLKILAKAAIATKNLNLTSIEDERLKVLIAGGVFESISRLNIDGKTLIINDIMDHLNRHLTDRGLFQYISIKYYNLIAMDSFTRMNYKEFSEKEFPASSCLAPYKELIVCFNYLQYTVNRTLNQSIVIRSIDLFHRWLASKPNSVLNNNNVLLLLEFNFVKFLTHYLAYQDFSMEAIRAVDAYLQVRTTILGAGQSFQLKYLKCQILARLSLGKELQLQADSLSPVAPLDIMRQKLIRFEALIHQGNRLQVVEPLFEEISVDFQSNPNYALQSDVTQLTRFKIIEILQLLCQFSYLSAVLKSQQSDYIGAVLDIRRSVRLAKVILAKHFSHLTGVNMIELNALKWQISRTLLRSLNFGLELTISRGLTKSCLYYTDEILAFLKPQSSPILISSNYYTIAEFWLICKKFVKSNEYMIRSDEIYNSLEFEDNLLELKGLSSHAFYFQMIGDTKNENLYYDKVESFYKELSEGKLDKNLFALVQKEPQWFQNLQLEIEFKKFLKMDPMRTPSSQFCRFGPNSGKSHIITAKKSLMLAKNLLNSDAVFSGLKESVVTVPSTLEDSTRKDKFMMKKVLANLNDCEKSMESVILKDRTLELKLYEIHDISKIMINSFTLKHPVCSIGSPKGITAVEEVARYAPFIFERSLADAGENPHQMIPDPKRDIGFEIPNDVYANLKSVLPNSWVVLTIDLCPYTGDLLVSRYDRSLQEPFLLRLPLNRPIANDLDDSAKSSSFEDVMQALEKLIEESNATTKVGRISQIKSRNDKLQWWDERRALDEQLGALLRKAEANWFGGFRGIFSQIRPNEVLKQEFVAKFEIILNQYLPSRFNKKSKLQAQRVDLHPYIIELFFLNLQHPLESTDEMEDLIYFLLDTLLFHGEENVVEEVDVDHMYIEIEELLTKYHESNCLGEFQNFNHSVLIVGKDCCNFPWESLPSLRQSSISRLPSLQMLTDLLAANPSRELSVNRGFYIVNPNGDLSKTEQNFREMFAAQDKWNGIVGVKPSEDQFATALSSSDLLVYIGHGSGDQYIRSSTIKSIKRCTASLLIGCSSGILRDHGMLEPYGPVYTHLIANSPMCLVNLWDVTDKDIDRFTLSLFEKWGLFRDADGSRTITEAVLMSRDECTLKFLNGAAPIVYGLPLTLKSVS